MTSKVVKHILVDNRSDLSTILVFNFDIGRKNVDYGIQKF